MNSNITVGITGGIGTGKSTICRILNIMGYPVFYSDEVAKRLFVEDKDVISKVKNAFGDNAYENGILNRKHIAGIVFSQPEKREALNKIIHPEVRKHFKQWQAEQQSALVFNEAAILFETGAYKLYSYTILIVSPIELRLKRISARDNTTYEEIQKRIDSQWSDEQKLPLANFVIHNDETNLLIPQILAILKEIKK